jgi:hypothetical protein
MYDGLLAIDPDAPKMENPVVFFDHLDAPYRDGLGSRTDRYGQPRLVVHERGRAAAPGSDGPGKGAFAAVVGSGRLGGGGAASERRLTSAPAVKQCRQ